MTTDTKQLTIDEFETLVRDPVNTSRRLELINGEVVESMPTLLHAAIVSLLNFLLMQYLIENPIGWALPEARFVTPDDPNNARIPDLSFIGREKGPLIAKGPAPYMPDLAIEVQSPGQSDKFMLDKANYYLANGSRMVWLVYPDRRLIEVLTPESRRILTANETVLGGDLLPGFSVAVARVFDVDLPTTSS